MVGSDHGGQGIFLDANPVHGNGGQCYANQDSRCRPCKFTYHDNHFDHRLTPVEYSL